MQRLFLAAAIFWSSAALSASDFLSTSHEMIRPSDHKCLTASATGNGPDSLSFQVCDGGDRQRWQLSYRTYGFYLVASVASGRCVTPVSDVYLMLNPCQEQEALWWRFYQSGDDVYALQARSNNNCLGLQDIPRQIVCNSGMDQLYLIPQQ